MTTIGESISRVRNLVKGVKEDAFLTDRLLYSLILKYAKLLIRRQDNESKIMRFQSLFEVLPCIELIEVDRVEACCGNIRSGCTFKRTKEKLPSILEGSYGPLFRSITSVDGSIETFCTYPTTYNSMTTSTNFKYNKTKYYWYLDGHLFFPNLDWDAVRVEGLWSSSIAMYKCDGDICAPRQNEAAHFPEYLFAEIEQMVMKDLTLLIQTPVEGQDDKMNPLRT